MDYCRDEYGSVPSEFQVIEEFPIHYWEENITHNYIINFDLHPYIEEAQNNFQRLKSYDYDYDYIYQTTFTHWSGDKYTIIIARDEPTSF